MSLAILLDHRQNRYVSVEDVHHVDELAPFLRLEKK